MLGNGQEGLARGVHHFGLVALRLIETALPLRDASLLAQADDRVLRDIEAGADVRYGDASRVEISDLSALGRGERSELDPMRQTRHSGTLITGGKVRRQARDQIEERLPLFREGVGEGHQKCHVRTSGHWSEVFGVVRGGGVLLPLGFALQDCWEVAVEEVVVDGFVLAVGDLVVVEVDLVEDGLVEVAS